MKSISEILEATSHRPYEMPIGCWKYYQEWNHALFLHWIVPFEVLRKHVPSQIGIDTFEGNCYVSLVAFKMQEIRPRNLPAISFISDFDEINLRTYIDNDNKKGVYFLNIEAEKLLSVLIAKSISGLPYEKAIITSKHNEYKAMNLRKGFELHAAFKTENIIEQKSLLDIWLTERYCLYVKRTNAFYRYDIHHKEWELKNVTLKKLYTNYKIGAVDFSNKDPDVMHYSDGIKVIAWGRQKIE